MIYKPAMLCPLQNEFVCSLFLDGPKVVQESVAKGNFLLLNNKWVYKKKIIKVLKEKNGTLKALF